MTDILKDEDMACLKYMISRLVRMRSSRHENRVPESPRVSKEKERVLRDDVLESLFGKTAADTTVPPSDEDLRRMYDIVQADAKLSNRLSGLGFGRNGDAYRRAAVKMNILSLVRLMRDGKHVRNDIVHRPGYTPSEDVSDRVMKEYHDAEHDIDERLRGR